MGNLSLACRSKKMPQNVWSSWSCVSAVKLWYSNVFSRVPCACRKRGRTREKGQRSGFVETNKGDIAGEGTRAVDGRTRTSEPTGGGASATAGSTSAMTRDGRGVGASERAVRAPRELPAKANKVSEGVSREKPRFS